MQIDLAFFSEPFRSLPEMYLNTFMQVHDNEDR